MAFRSALFTFASLALGVASPAIADIINYDGSSTGGVINMNVIGGIDQGHVHNGQTGNMTNMLTQQNLQFGHFYLVSDVFGTLPAYSRITFSYSFPDVNPDFYFGGDLTSRTPYGHESHGWANTVESHTSNYINGVAAATALVLATANLNGSSGTTTLTNSTGDLSDYHAFFQYGFDFTPSSNALVTYAVSTIPLPSSLPLYTAVLLALACLAFRSRKRFKG